MARTTDRSITAMISAAQIRAARGLLGWSRARLAGAARLTAQAVRRMEGPAGPGASTRDDVAQVVGALERAGVEFTNGAGPGVRLRPKAAFIRPEELTSETDL